MTSFVDLCTHVCICYCSGGKILMSSKSNFRQTPYPQPPSTTPSPRSFVAFRWTALQNEHAVGILALFRQTQMAILNPTETKVEQRKEKAREIVRRQLQPRYCTFLSPFSAAPRLSCCCSHGRRQRGRAPQRAGHQTTRSASQLGSG